MKANEFVKKFGLGNAEDLLNKSKLVQQKYFRKLKTPCGGIVDAEELMNVVLANKIKNKVSQIGFENLNEFINVLEVDSETFGSGIVTSCYILRLKRLVESHELVKDYYGLTRAKEHAESNYTAPELKAALKQAIADVESCKESFHER